MNFSAVNGRANSTEEKIPLHKQKDVTESLARNCRFLLLAVFTYFFFFKALTTGITLNKIRELDKYCQMYSVEFIFQSYE